MVVGASGVPLVHRPQQAPQFQRPRISHTRQAARSKTQAQPPPEDRINRGLRPRILGIGASNSIISLESRLTMAYENAVEPGAMSPRCCMESARSSKVQQGRDGWGGARARGQRAPFAEPAVLELAGHDHIGFRNRLVHRTHRLLIRMRCTASTAAAALARYFPTRRATRIDPAITLRAEEYDTLNVTSDQKGAPMSSENNSLDRRDFLRKASAISAALGSAGAALGEGKSSKSSSARSSGRVIGANDRIAIGVIGVGGRGSSDASSFAAVGEKDNSCQIVAVADTYQKRVNRAKEAHKCDGYLDYREIINRKDIDAVVVATPDHWHARIALEAMDQGKDVYLEKPMCHTIEEAQQLVANRAGNGPRAPGRLANHVGRSMVEGEKGHRRRHDRQDDHEPGLLSSQLDRGRMELSHRCRCRTGRQGRRLHRLEDVAGQGACAGPTTPTASSVSANIGIIRAASPRTCSSTWSRH